MAFQSYIKRSISYLISSGRLLAAITRLKEEFQQLRDYKGLDMLDKVASTYNYLLKFLKEGTPDPQRESVLNDLREKLFNLEERVVRLSKAKDSQELYYTLSRLTDYSSLNFSEALGRFVSSDSAHSLSAPGSKEYHESLTAMNIALKDIFTVVWTGIPGDNSDLDSIVNVAADSDISFSLRCVIIGALIMNLLHSYDKARFNALMNIESRSSSEKIRARAIIGMALIIEKYKQRIARDTELKVRFETLADDLTFYTRMREAIYSIVKARGGMNYLRKMQLEIIPDIHKLGPDFLEKLKDTSGEISMEKIEENPEWEKMMEKSGMEKKLRRLTNMQASGADMMLSMFEQVSKNFFFNDIDAWFRPFEDWEAERLGVSSDLKQLLELFSLNPTLCDSDKFAMVSNLQRLPDSAKTLMRSAFEAQSKELTEEMKSMMLRTKTPEFDIECYNYARTLFRFFTFFRARKEFKNPFESAPSFRSWPFIGLMLGEKEILSAVAEYCFRQGFYEDAISMFEELKSDDPGEDWQAFCIQKIGCSLEHLGRKDEALKFFIQAFEINPTDEWIAKKIVKLSYSAGSFPVETRDALIFLYRKDKDNLLYLLPLARFEIDGWNYVSPEGKQSKFLDRAAYLAPDNYEVLILLALKELKKGRDESNLAEALGILQPIVDNAEMLLASRALTENVATNPGSDSGSEKVDNATITIEPEIENSGEIEKMISALRVSLYINFLLGNYSSNVTLLRDLRDLRKEKFSLMEITNFIKGYFGEDSPVKDFELALPLWIDALNLEE